MVIKIYTKEVMEHFRNPKNMGEMEDADGVGKVGNIICGDVMWIFIKVEESDKQFIKDIKFRTMGCAAAIATSSMMTELAKGKTLEDALKLTQKDIAESLGGLPPIKVHCSVLAIDALREAIYDYLSKNNMPIPKELMETHKKVERELEMTRKRYEEFVQRQERSVESGEDAR